MSQRSALSNALAQYYAANVGKTKNAQAAAAAETTVIDAIGKAASAPSLNGDDVKALENLLFFPPPGTANREQIRLVRDSFIGKDGNVVAVAYGTPPLPEQPSSARPEQGANVNSGSTSPSSVRASPAMRYAAVTALLARQLGIPSETVQADIHISNESRQQYDEFVAAGNRVDEKALQSQIEARNVLVLPALQPESFAYMAFEDKTVELEDLLAKVRMQAPAPKTGTAGSGAGGTGNGTGPQNGTKVNGAENPTSTGSGTQTVPSTEEEVKREEAKEETEAENLDSKRKTPIWIWILVGAVSVALIILIVALIIDASRKKTNKKVVENVQRQAVEPFLRPENDRLVNV